MTFRMSDVAANAALSAPMSQVGATIVMLSGGTNGQTYVIECEVEFESGRRLNRSAKLKVRDL